MARKSVRQVSYQDVEWVQNLVERCIQLYMTPKEVVTTLQNQANIEPEFTKSVLQRLEEQNPEFFKAYYTRLALKQQIEEFNKLLEKQKQLMELEQQTKVASLPTSNGFQYHVASSLPTSSEFHMFAANENIINEAVPNFCIASATPITGTNLESNSHLANEAALDLPNTSNGSFPRNFSLPNISDLDYLFDVQDNYPEAQPFLDCTIDDFDIGSFP
ncbi:unnamed protein product [Trifolium pratense]|uniref:Uncharacterized protein n=1 Tax=Trifolium pratense TaxID=57577 RepID=A0ACB0LWY9_TRIPR|nr:unnamed protein product [Trifolium pratense]